MKFILTVDTEEDNQWKTSSRKLKNLEFLPRFQDLCAKYSIKPVYFLTYGAANSHYAEYFKILATNGKAEIGAHLHPWSNPPFFKDDEEQRFPNELSESEFSAKLERLTNIIKEKIGVKPKIYRAGKWGFKNNHAKILNKFGYKIDSSITPGINWGNYKKGGADFSCESNEIKIIDGIKEYPMTILNTGYLSRFFSFYEKKFFKRKNDFIKKVINKLIFKQRWLRILPGTSSEDLIKVVKFAEIKNLQLIVFMIHSSELMPGGSPYFKTEKSIEEMYQTLENFLKYIKSKNLENIKLSNMVNK